MAEFLSPKAESRLLRGMLVAAGVLALVPGDTPINTDETRSAQAQQATEHQTAADRAIDEHWSLLTNATRIVAESETCKITHVEDHGVHRIAPEGDRPALRRAVELTIERQQSEKGRALEQAYPQPGPEEIGSIALDATSMFQPLVVSGRRLDKLGNRNWIQEPAPVPNGYAPHNLNQQQWHIDQHPQQLASNKRVQPTSKLWITPYADWDVGSTISIKFGTEVYGSQQVSENTDRSQSVVGTALCENIVVFEKNADGDGAWILQNAQPSGRSVVTK